MSNLTSDIQANLELFVADTKQTNLVWGLRNEEGWLSCDSTEFENSEVMPFWSAKKMRKRTMSKSGPILRYQKSHSIFSSKIGYSLCQKMVFQLVPTGMHNWKVKKQNLLNQRKCIWVNKPFENALSDFMRAFLYCFQAGCCFLTKEAIIASRLLR